MPGSISLPDIPWQMINLSSKTDKAKNSFASKGSEPSDKNDSQLKKACSEFESLFVYYLLKEMRATIPKSGFISGGRAEEIYTSMLDSQLARELSSKGGIGISSLLLHQLGHRKGEVKE